MVVHHAFDDCREFFRFNARQVGDRQDERRSARPRATPAAEQREPSKLTSGELRASSPALI
jgi:hypothetical protein